MFKLKIVIIFLFVVLSCVYHGRQIKPKRNKDGNGDVEYCLHGLIAIVAATQIQTPAAVFRA